MPRAMPRASTYWYVPVHTSTYGYILVRTSMYCIVTRFYQVQLINSAIDKAKKGSYLHGLPRVADPSAEVQEVLIGRCESWPRLRVDRRWIESYSAGSCCGWYLDNFWPCQVGVRAVPGRNACQMLPVQAAKVVPSWHEPTGIHGSISHYIQYVHVHT